MKAALASGARNVALVFLGVAGLVLKGRYSGPHEMLVHSYGGNVAASFAVYFMFANPCRDLRFRRALTAALAFAAVELFEATDGFFNAMSNVYDPIDYLANAGGISVALAVDAIASRVWDRPPAY